MGRHGVGREAPSRSKSDDEGTPTALVGRDGAGGTGTEEEADGERPVVYKRATTAVLRSFIELSEGRSGPMSRHDNPLGVPMRFTQISEQLTLLERERQLRSQVDSMTKVCCFWKWIVTVCYWSLVLIALVLGPPGEAQSSETIQATCRDGRCNMRQPWGRDKDGS